MAVVAEVEGRRNSAAADSHGSSPEAVLDVVVVRMGRVDLGCTHWHCTQYRKAGFGTRCAVGEADSTELAGMSAVMGDRQPESRI